VPLPDVKLLFQALCLPAVQFLVRGITKVKGEFGLMCIAHNIKKVASHCEKNVFFLFNSVKSVDILNFQVN